MNIPRSFFLGLATVSLAVACATSGDDAINGTPPVDAGGSKTDAGGSKTDSGGGGGACVQTCQTDNDCQSSCPAPGQGIYCCDTVNAVCYVENSTVCPEPPDASMGD